MRNTPRLTRDGLGATRTLVRDQNPRSPLMDRDRAAALAERVENEVPTSTVSHPGLQPRQTPSMQKAASSDNPRRASSLLNKILGRKSEPGESSSGVRQSKYSEARTSLIDGMQQMKQHYSTLLAQDWSPDIMDSRYDAAMLPIFLATENKRSPNLKLKSLSSEGTREFGEWLAHWHLKERQPHTRVMFTMFGFSAHQVTADIRRDKKGNVSILIVEPLGLKANAERVYKNEALPILQKLLDLSLFKGKVALTVLALDTMKSDTGCQIFGLSAASKMAKEDRLFGMLHEQNLSGQIMTSKGANAPVLAFSGRVKIIDGKGVLPISFFKHSQSKTTVNEYLGENPPAYANVLVNKSEKSLIQRYNDYQTIRYKNPARLKYLQTMQRQPKIETLRVSTSIEHKRLTYIDRAIDYLKGASDTEMKALEHLMGGNLRLLDKPEPGKLYVERRKLGPSPDRLSDA